ncbi:MAG TPA: alpha/beta hydrolase domain-containing protein [Casimicrobiaceae bacterium]|nr:alpha/beta hydrolase domain-containing protein [Casimicrobiaceae bacterium]
MLHRLITPSVASISAACGLLFAISGSADARVTKITITSKVSPAYNGQSFGAAGQYETLSGTLIGEVDPNDRRNHIIQDIGLAPRNARGMVEYTATFFLTKPIDMTKSSRVLLHQVPNRGGRIDIGGRAAGDVGLSSGWQGDLTGSQVERVTVPVAKNLDGSSITGPYTFTIADLGTGSPISADGSTATIYAGLNNPTIAYPPASTDTAQAQLTSYATYSFNTAKLTDERVVPSADWSFGDCTSTPFPGTPSGTRICVRGGFDKSRIYRLVYRVKDPLVLGLGLAAFRDAADFFRRAKADDAGTPNPLAGTIDWAIIQGTSQSGNFAKTAIHLGFTESDAVIRRRVWDGAIPFIAARQNPINYRFAISGGEGKLYEQGTDPVLWWEPYTDTARGRTTAGMLDRCRASGTCPKITEIFTSPEFWNLRMSPGHIGTKADVDIPLPNEVRRYYIPSTTHGGGNGAFTITPPATGSTLGGCELPSNPMPAQATLRALTQATIEWVTMNREMPPSQYPKLSDGTLVHESQLRFPPIPGKRSPIGLVNTIIDYDYGSSFNYNDMSGFITAAPIVVKQLIPTYVPQVDADGNEIAGVKALLALLPLGTYTGWNITSNGFYKGQACAFSGGFIPFAKTQAERIAAGDPRPSLEERYVNVWGYYWQALTLVDRMVQDRFLLPADAAATINALLNQLLATDILRKRAGFELFEE